MRPRLRSNQLLLAPLLLLALLVSACGGDDPTAPQTTHHKPTFDAGSWEIAASTAYEGEAGSGIVSYFPAEGVRKGVLVGVVGISFDPEAPGLAELPEFLSEIHDMGFDVYVLLWENGSDYIQRNAFVLKELLDQLHAEERVAGDDELVVAGLSMGGVVSRYCLTWMESRGLDHGVDLFVSQDSPQRGAYIPLGLQYCNQYFAELGELVPKNDAAKLLAQIDAPASQQLLTHHFRGPGGGSTPAFQAFWNELRSLGDWPESSRNVAIADGRGDGQREDEPNTLLHWESDEFKVLDESKTFEFDYLLGTFTKTITVKGYEKLTIDIRPTSDFGESKVFEAKLSPRWVINGRSVDSNSESSVRKLIRDLIEEVTGTWVPNSILDAAIKPFSQEISGFSRSMHAKYEGQAMVTTTRAMEFIPGGQGDKTGLLGELLDDHGTVTSLHPNHCFIPSSSALSVDTSSDGRPLLETSDFDAVYFHDRNRNHISNSSDTIGWLVGELEMLLTGTPAS